MIKKERLFLILFALIILSHNSLAQSTVNEEADHLIANSENWRDVYSVFHYANLVGKNVDFLVSTKHGSLLMNEIGQGQEIRVISSEQPFVIDYPNLLEDNGFENTYETQMGNPNIELAEELGDISNYIIVGNTYGYNAIAVAPYASITRAWVFFADQTNIDEIDALMSSKNAENVLIYGYVHRDVRETLEKYNPETIDTGDRFKDNIEIVKKYKEIKNMGQVVLTNGDFIEREIMSGAEPVLFTGKQNVPEQIKEYLATSDINIGVLIGSDLVGAATNIRRETGINVIVKFARGARARTGAISAVEGLDLFYLANPIITLGLHSAKYNRATSQLEVTYRSDSNIPIYFRGTITPKDETGTRTRIGDVEPIFIAPSDYKTVSYSDIEFTGEQLSLDIFTLFGETQNSLERILEATVDVEIINVIDGCQIEILKVKYSKPKEAFVIKVKNNAEVDCWVDIELTDVVIDGSRQTIGSEGATRIAAGRSKNIFINQEMTDEDLETNSLVDLTAFYGEREDSLVKVLQGKFELKIEIISTLMIAIILVVLAILILLFFLWRRRKEDENDW